MYNTLFLLTIFWSLHCPDSDDAIFMSSALNVLSILLDAIIIGIYYGVSTNAFSTFMLIVNLLLRPITSLILLRFYNERGRLSSINFSGLPVFGASTSAGESRIPGASRASYEDLDRQPIRPKDIPPPTHHQSVPSHHRSSDSPTVDLLGHPHN